MSRALIIMAKQPEPGTTKTRLTPAMTPEGAAAFYQAMLTDIVTRLTRRSDATVMIAAAAATSVEWFEDCLLYTSPSPRDS